MLNFRRVAADTAIICLTLELSSQILRRYLHAMHPLPFACESCSCAIQCLRIRIQDVLCMSLFEDIPNQSSRLLKKLWWHHPKWMLMYTGSPLLHYFNGYLQLFDLQLHHKPMELCTRFHHKNCPMMHRIGHRCIVRLTSEKWPRDHWRNFVNS